MEQDKLYLQVLFDSIENHNFKDHTYWVLYIIIFLYIYLTSFFSICCNRSSYFCNVILCVIILYLVVKRPVGLNKVCTGTYIFIYFR